MGRVREGWDARAALDPIKAWDLESRVRFVTLAGASNE